MFYSFSQPGFPLAPLQAAGRQPEPCDLSSGRGGSHSAEAGQLPIRQQRITSCFSSVFQGVTDMVTFIKTRAFSNRIFTVICKWNGGGLMWPRKAFAPHRGFWIAHGKVLKIIFGLKDELYIFLWRRKNT